MTHQQAWIPRLVSLGGDIDGRDFQGNTPLMVAAERVAMAEGEALSGGISTINMLLASDADRAMTDGDGLTALGRMRRANRSTKYNAVHVLNIFCHMQPRQPLNPELEALLRPDDGPTAVDEDAKDEDDDFVASGDRDDY
jgi:hypothetical protein